MIVKLEFKDVSMITMEQKAKGQKVKITVVNKAFGKDVVWASVEDANKFYKKRLLDGYKVV